MGNVFGGCEVILKARHTPASVCSECRAQQRCTDAVQGAEKTGSSKRNKVSLSPGGDILVRGTHWEHQE